MKTRLIKTIKSALGNAEYFGTKWNYAPNELVVICMHSTPAFLLPRFRVIVTDLLQKFTPLSPQEVPTYFSNRDQFNKGPYILFTFDDGLKNNLNSARILEELGVKALYFLVPDFIKSSDSETYYRTYIRPEIDTNIDREKEDLTAMNLDEIRSLIALGHSVGFHTKSHTLSGDMPDAEVDLELSDPKGVLTEFDKHIRTHFASPNNTSMSVNGYCKKQIEKNFQLHYSTFPGMNNTAGSAQLILRRNIEVHWSNGEIRFAIGRWDLNRWQARLAHYHQI